VKVVLPVLALCAWALAVPPAHAQGSAPGGPAAAQPSPARTGETATVPSAQPLSLSLLDALARALEHNLGVLMAEERVKGAEGSRWTALADLLPNVSGRVSETRQRINLAAFGFPLPPGTPSLVGPFNVFDARISVSQSLLDFRAVNDARAQRHQLAAANYGVQRARDLVVLVAGNLYLHALASSVRVDSARAQMQTAQAVLDQANSMKAAGMVAGIDVLRAEVQLSTERQRATAARNELEKTKLQLARVIGLPPGQTFTLSDTLPQVPAPEMSVEQALARAYASRPDYLAAQARVRAAEAARRAVVGEYLPSLRVNADYGRIGLTPGEAEGTYAVAGIVNIPVFNGGRTRGRLIQADAELRSRQAELDDLRASIDVEVRSSFLDLEATSEQLQVATRSRDLAAQQLTQARDRFAAGVASNIEVVQAQEAVATSSEQYISALYGFNSAKAALARDLGLAEETVREFLGGVR
jgi:outer membrane protein TolC